MSQLLEDEDSFALDGSPQPRFVDGRAQEVDGSADDLFQTLLNGNNPETYARGGIELGDEIDVGG